jgi:rubrerythrin
MNIFDFAMQMEKDGETYYHELAAKCNVAGLKRILNLLANDEVGHYNTLEKLKRGSSTKIIATEVLKNAKNIFQEMKEGEQWDIDVPEIQLYEKAIEVEKKSEDFYKEKADETDQAEVREILLKIAEDEKRHQYLLENTINFLSRPKTWIENAEFHHLDEY